MDIPKKYDSKLSERKWQEFWKKQQLYKFKKGKKVFSIDTPPPYASADHLHVGHAMHYSQFEFVARYKRMKGFNVFFPMGFDDNGLPTERYVEKKHKVNKNNITRSEFIKLCIKETEKTGKTYNDLFTELGFSVDWDLLYHTIGNRARAVSQKSFIDLFKKGKLYQKDSPVMWDTKLQTVLAQADLEDVEIKSHFNDITFKVGSKNLTIATTRPELIPACVAVFFNPKDKRYQNLNGKFAKVPLMDYDVPILEDEAVSMEKGTGIVMCCTFGDKMDIEWWQKYNLPLRVVIDESGRLNKNAGKYEGKKIKEARTEIIQDLKDAKLLTAQKDIVHAVNVSERSGAEIEYLKSKQWYIRVLDAKEELLEQGRKINWHPKTMRVRYEHWVENLNWDWCISRQRYYGVQFPVWYSKKTGEVILADESQLPIDPLVDKPKTLPKGHTYKDIIPEEDVMDTWMTSSVSPEINAHWGLKTESKGFLPMSLRPQAHDIIRTWAFYTILKSYYHHGRIPWDNIMMSGHGQDPHGKKMSKSKNNFIIAQDIIKKYSADALRYWAASTKLGEDMPFMEKEVLTGHKTVNKLWNASKFTLSHLEDYKRYTGNLEEMDKWIISKFNKVVKVATKSFDEYEYSRAKKEVDHFFWNVFCDYYLEIIKDRLYNPKGRGKNARRSAQTALHHVLSGVLKLFAPIMPHITEEIYQIKFSKDEKQKSIHVSQFPEYDKKLDKPISEKAGDLVVQIIAAVRKLKSEKQMSLGKEVDILYVTIPKDMHVLLTESYLDLKAACRAKDLELKEGKTMKVEFK